MPLSEQEQRILRQIERQFSHERGLARFMRPPRDVGEAARNAKRAAAGFVVGLAALAVAFATSWVVGLVGFLIMLGSALTLVQCLRRLGQDRLDRLQSQYHPLSGHMQRGAGEAGGRRWVRWGGPRSDDEEQGQA